MITLHGSVVDIKLDYNNGDFLSLAINVNQKGDNFVRTKIKVDGITSDNLIDLINDLLLLLNYAQEFERNRQKLDEI